MPKARQQYFADEISLNKEARTFSLDDELLQKIEDMDIGEENVIEVVKVNSVPLPVDAQKAVDVTVPLVMDNLTSTSTTNSLSANQGKILYDYIVNLQSRGRFLSSWNASTGTPVTAPFGSGYNYNPGDYYVVTIVNSGGTNYRPDGTTYISGQASTVVETENVEISDMYIFDGTQWLFQKNTARQIAVDSSLSTTSTNPVENRVITNELNCTFGTVGGKAGVQLQTSYSNYPTNYIISPIIYDNVPVTAIYWGYVTSASGWQGHFGNCGATDNADCLRMRSDDSDYLVTAYGDSSGTSTMTLNIWTMYAVTIQGTSGTIYINGQQSSTFTTGSSNTGTGPRAWGHQAGWSTQIHPFVGWLRQSALYNRCLSAQEISDYYNATV